MNSTDQDMAPNLTVKQQSAMRDEQLVSAALAGSSDAFAELESFYSRHLYSTIVRITKNREDAEDALQDTFLRAYLALSSFEGRSSFYSWLTRIAINSALMTIRKRRARTEVSFDSPRETEEETLQFEIRDAALNPEQTFDQGQRCVNLLHAIHKLKPNLRGPIQIRMAHGFSMKEIAQALGISDAAVKARLHRARMRITRANTLRDTAKSKRAASVRQHEDIFSSLQNREQPCLSCS